MLVVALTAIAGCSVPPGVAITVKTDKATATVELFVGNDSAGDCDSAMTSCAIGPKSVVAATRGKIYVGAGWTSKATVADRTTVKGGVAHFQLQVDDDAGGDQFVPALIVVGYDAAGTTTSVAVIHDIDVPAHSSVEIRTTLQPAMPMTAPASAGERVEVWRQPDDDTATALGACVIVGHADNTIEFATPAADTDCDGAQPRTSLNMTGECSESNAWNYCGTTLARLSETTCIKSVTTTTTTMTTTACRLAGPQCLDGSPACAMLPATLQPGPCELTGEIACLPVELCNQPCMEWSDACLTNLIAMTQLPKVECHFVFLQADPVPCGGWPILTVDGNTAAVILGGRTCTATQLATIEQPIQIGSSVQLARPPAPPSTLSLVVPTGGSACAPEVHLTGMPLVDTQTVLDVLSGPGQQQHRMVYTHVASTTTTGSCAGLASTCSVIPPPGGYTYQCQ